MDLESRINEDIKAAMRSREKNRLDALRAIKSSILLAKTEKGAAGDGLGDETGIKILQKLVKQRKESAELYTSQGREDLALEEIAQMQIIEKYLPEKLTGDEIHKIIDDIIAETGAGSIRDMGKVMGLASKKIAGKADNKKIADIIKEKLNR
ncbi:MAG: GatB/YqeY domain-containing protein [Bacteroidales bacterium]